MDRHFQIALISAALAALWGYAFHQRLREGYVRLWKHISKEESPGQFWSAMIIFSVPEAVFVGLAVSNFFDWWLGSSL